MVQPGGDGISDAGSTHQQGEHVRARSDHTGDVGAPLPVAPVNAAATMRLTEGRPALQRVATLMGGERTSASRNLEGGGEAPSHRQALCPAGRIPHSTANPRNRTTPTRRRTRVGNAALHALRERVERTLAWADQCPRLLLCFESPPRWHDGLKLLAHTRSNVRRFGVP